MLTTSATHFEQPKPLVLYTECVSGGKTSLFQHSVLTNVTVEYAELAEISLTRVLTTSAGPKTRFQAVISRNFVELFLRGPPLQMH